MAAIQGDWYIGHSDSESYPVKDQMRCVFADQTDGDRFMVAKVWGDLDGDYESTARLIAAAPDLLAALKDLWGWEDVIEEWDRKLHGRMKAAIAKAEGGVA